MSTTSKNFIDNKQYLIKKNLFNINDLIDQITNYFTRINFILEKNSDINYNSSDVKKIHQSIEFLKSEVTQYINKSDYDNSAESWQLARHELRTKVGSISGYAEIIVAEIDGQHHELINNFKQIIDTVPVILNAIENMTLDSQLTFKDIDSDVPIYPFCFLGNAPDQSTILLVDDSHDKRSLIKRRLLASHHIIIEAQSAEEALKFINTTMIDLILLDLILPEMSGYNLLILLKSQAITADIPVLITSSLNEIENIVQCIRAGAEDYLLMPIDKTLLLARVNASLVKKKLMDQSKHYQQEIVQMQKCLDAALQSVNDGFVIYDHHDRIYMCNQPFQQLYPAFSNADTAYKITYEKFLKINYDSNLYCHLPEHGYMLYNARSNGFTEWSQERLAKHRHPDQPYLEQFRDGRWIEITEKSIPQGGVVAIHSDVTQRIEREQEYQHIASHDELTGLYNRYFFEKILLKTIHSYREEKFAILFFDLDGFKAVNDHFGHKHGDFLLKNIANKLSETLRATDILARIGGDEFCALITQFTNVNELEKLAVRCANAVGDNIEYQGKQLNFGISIGISYYPKHGNTAESLLSYADAAMYVAKKLGKNQYHVAE